MASISPLRSDLISNSLVVAIHPWTLSSCRWFPDEKSDELDDGNEDEDVLLTVRTDFGRA